MNQRELSREEIRDIAFRTTGQSHNSDWKCYRYGNCRDNEKPSKCHLDHFEKFEKEEFV